MPQAQRKTAAERKAQLLNRQDDLRARLAAIETELDSHSEQDWEELAVEREGDEVLEATGLGAQQEIRMIEAALARNRQRRLWRLRPLRRRDRRSAAGRAALYAVLPQLRGRAPGKRGMMP